MLMVSFCWLKSSTAFAFSRCQVSTAVQCSSVVHELKCIYRYLQSCLYVTAFTVAPPRFYVLFYMWLCNVEKKIVMMETGTCLHEKIGLRQSSR